ncbi:MAG: hypothetical protein FJ290_28015 [Planctomycetes bacterium]|nr:hypothetical protein [Planctomycetota bacterium]
MRVEEVQRPVPQGGLAALDDVVLDARLQGLLDARVAACGGPRWWASRKRAEARDLAAMSVVAPRFKVCELDLRETFRALATLRAPVPCRPNGAGQLRVERLALLGITYEPRYVFEDAPGYAFVTILEPAGVWHPNVATRPAQAVCLGPTLPAGILVKDLVVLTYAALAMDRKLVQMDERAAAGVMNAEAAVWWQQHGGLVPLTGTPFLAPGD